MGLFPNVFYRRPHVANYHGRLRDKDDAVRRPKQFYNNNSPLIVKNFDYYCFVVIFIISFLLPGIENLVQGLVWSHRWTKHLVDKWVSKHRAGDVIGMALFTRFGLTRFYPKK